jgi:hypothetical protein
VYTRHIHWKEDAMTEHALAPQLSDWIVQLMSADAEPSPTRDYYFVLLRQGRSVPEAVGMAVDDLLEEVRTAVSLGESYNPRTHRARLSLPSFVPFSAHRLPRPALVRRIVQERMGGPPDPAGRHGPRRGVPGPRRDRTNR